MPKSSSPGNSSARVAPVESADGAVGPQHRVLYEVLGVGGVPGDRAGHPVEHLDLGHHPAIERGLLVVGVDTGIGHGRGT
jgi:hypothetical protein